MKLVSYSSLMDLFVSLTNLFVSSYNYYMIASFIHYALTQRHSFFVHTRKQQGEGLRSSSTTRIRLKILNWIPFVDRNWWIKEVVALPPNVLQESNLISKRKRKLQSQTKIWASQYMERFRFCQVQETKLAIFPNNKNSCWTSKHSCLGSNFV